MRKAALFPTLQPGERLGPGECPEPDLRQLRLEATLPEQVQPISGARNGVWLHIRGSMKSI